ncbi:hypothetical protein [Actinoplanes sp. G11-F43]|uniref:hypothetical protein n=1 Tax=Actinoplanes sp. G11-F43 TaxID=3424130 RepID=UPI003D331E2F
MKVLSRLLILVAVLAVPVLLAVASQAMTRPPGPPALPTAPIEISFQPGPDPSTVPSAGPSAPEVEPGVERAPRPTPTGDDDDDDLDDD